MSTIIRVDQISKQYRLGQVGTGTISHDLNRWWHRVRGKEDPYLTIGEENDRTKKGNSDYAWAIKEVSFEVKQGEVLGIVGRNGAGKSTLLKILSRITSPTLGNVYIKGRVASLLEVGTGFHPELTGRENIYLNGAILGMKRFEIAKKFDEIVEFAGVERYVETPVKRYSSGMYVRLAFAVAAYLEPEILIVDEVLAVGDAEFQKKALGKMKDVSASHGRTVLFVSHNMLAMKSLCSTGLLMSNGMVEKAGTIEDVIFKYTSSASEQLSSVIHIGKEKNGLLVESLNINNNGINGNFDIEKDLEIRIQIFTAEDFEGININIFFKSADDAVIFATCSASEELSKGRYTYLCVVPAKTLNDIVYSLDLMVVQNGPRILHHFQNLISIEGVEEKRDGAWMGKFPGMIRPTNYKWTKRKLDDNV
jgi:lipopolysaccharide transport system ATP-binding protein